MHSSDTWIHKNEKLIFFAIFLLMCSGFAVRQHVISYSIGSGGNLYYSYLPTILLDHDLNISNQLDAMPYKNMTSPLFYQHKAGYATTSTGLTANDNSIGPAIFWSPFFIAGHAIVLTSNHYVGTNIRTDGLSNVEQILCMLGSIMYAVIGLYLCYRFATKFLPRWACLTATFFITFGYSVIHYIMIEPSMAHGITIFTVALFITYFYSHRFDHTFRKWFILGILAGLMMLSRWDTGFILPIFCGWYWLDMFWTEDDRWKFNFTNTKLNLILRGFTFLAGVIITFSPQMLIWKILFGGATTLPTDVINIIDFTHPLLYEFTLSWQHSLFISTPIIILACLGFFAFYKKDKWFTFTTIMTLLLIIYVNSSLQELGGNAFGARRMIDCTIFFILGLAALLAWAHKKKLLWPIIAICLFFISYNLIYLLEYNLNIINRFKEKKN